jgi:hypothetical protein
MVIFLVLFVSSFFAISKIICIFAVKFKLLKFLAIFYFEVPAKRGALRTQRPKSQFKFEESPEGAQLE